MRSALLTPAVVFMLLLVINKALTEDPAADPAPDAGGAADPAAGDGEQADPAAGGAGGGEQEDPAAGGEEEGDGGNGTSGLAVTSLLSVILPIGIALLRVFENKL